MAKPLDDDLRKRIVEAMQEAGYCRAVGRQFRVAASTVSRLMKRVERTGARAPGKMGGHRRVLEEHRDWVAARVEARPETALKELQQDLLAERGVQAGEDTAGRFVRSFDFTFKKTLIAEERDREDAELRCEEYLRDQGRMLAEAGLHRRDPDQDRHGPDLGLGPQGREGQGKASFGHWKTSTLVAGLRGAGVVASRVDAGPTDGKLFLAYIEEAPAPALRPGGIVVMDNPGSRKGDAVRKAIEDVDAELRFLPPAAPTPT